MLDEAQPPSETPAKAAPIAKKSTKVPRVSKDEKSMINGKEEEGAESVGFIRAYVIDLFLRTIQSGDDVSHDTVSCTILPTFLPIFSC